jgi:lipopolysaccharide/colanic/teichoic acid biosynthesis glycosyltransferase
MPLATVDDIPLIDLGRRRCLSRYQRIKALLDKAVALTSLIVSAPVLLPALLAVKLTSRGPVIYRQERTGRDGKPFTLYKIRTMVDGAESKTGPTLSSGKDARVTPIGRILRASKIDELPQLANVLKGQMSLVGPRPERPCFVREFERRIPCYKERHRVCPGITGLAQVYGDYATSPDMKLRYDLMYVYNQSFWLDVKAALLTVRAILREIVPPKGEKRAFTPRAKVARPAHCRTLKIRRNRGADHGSDTVAVYLRRHRMRVC